jgi:hypothetical protein
VFLEKNDLYPLGVKIPSKHIIVPSKILNTFAIIEHTIRGFKKVPHVLSSFTNCAGYSLRKSNSQIFVISYP